MIIGQDQSGNPSFTDDYYNHLNGEWLDGQAITYGGDGRGGGSGASFNPTNFMFPDNSDPAFSTSWTISSAGFQPSDMRL